MRKKAIYSKEMPNKPTKGNECEADDKAIFRVSIGYATAAAQEISGDTAISCGLPDGSLALILSDGMGQGIRAAADSRMLVQHLRRNLKNGMSPAAAIKDVNSYMVKYGHGKEAESFATLDLLIIDRNSGKAKFYKMGAAASFLIRNANVRELEMAALPIGIVPRLRLTHIACKLKVGDIIVMVSDGVTEAGCRDMPGLRLMKQLQSLFADYERKEKTGADLSARKVAKNILDEAMTCCNDGESDDLTVAVIKIMPNPKK